MNLKGRSSFRKSSRGAKELSMARKKSPRIVFDTTSYWEFERLRWFENPPAYC